MPRILTQLHGYRQGHQLLAGAKDLNKVDQSLIDRLSDLAGPLRPGEQFDPYMTGYPLPSGGHYVLARTWQDLTVARAGCVRTLSMIVPTNEWTQSVSVAPFFGALNRLEMPDMAIPIELSGDAVGFPPVTGFAGDELLEALFLEDLRPVAVFDADEPDLIAARLLSALWPGLRERFSVSTFALSPRKIETKFFDLVFAPKDVRSRFASWPGRRIDARTSKAARHRWTLSIVDRVFKSPHPTLLDQRELDALSDDERGTPSALRISLLWDELLDKLASSPSAALGLLDVASSKFARGGSQELFEVKPLLANAAARAAVEMAPADGWAFVTAMLRKVQGTPFSSIVPAISDASRTLARRSPGGAVALLEQPDPSGTYRVLVPSIAEGLNEGFEVGGDQALQEALPETLANVLISDSELSRSAVSSAGLVRRILEVLPALQIDTFAALRRQIAPMLHTAEHGPLATYFIGSMDASDLLEELDILSGRGKVSLSTFVPILVDRSRELGAEIALRERALRFGGTTFSQKLVQHSIVPGARDARWIVNEAPGSQASELLAVLLRQANSQQLNDVFRDHDLARAAISLLSNEQVDILLRVAAEVWLPVDLYVSVVASVSAATTGRVATDLARQALQRCLREHFPGDEVAMLNELLRAARGGVDTGWIIHNSIAGSLSSSVVSRNMVVFASADQNLKAELAASIGAIAELLAGRWWIDLDVKAAASLTDLLTASQKMDRYAMLRASGIMLPSLMRSLDHPISSVIAVAFPVVYHELAREDDIPDFLRFIPLVDWDRCKSARHEFVDAFLSTHSWRPSDFALTAWRCHDTDRFIRRLAKTYRGDPFLDQILSDLSALPHECAQEVQTAVQRVRHSKY